MLAHFAPNERRTIKATTDARVVMVLAPWPGEGHPVGTRRVSQAAADAVYPEPAMPAPASVQITSSRPGPTPMSAIGTPTKSETNCR